LTTYIRPKEAARRTGLSKVTLWRYEAKGTFPARVQLGEFAVGYSEEEVERWIKSRVRAAGRSIGRRVSKRGVGTNLPLVARPGQPWTGTIATDALPEEDEQPSK
jgi:predicted DNA-binding transcriptional regulator AlpA